MSEEAELPEVHLGAENQTHFAVPPMAIPLGDQALVLYGHVADDDGNLCRIKLQINSETMVMKFTTLPGLPEEKETTVFEGNWYDLVKRIVGAK